MRTSLDVQQIGCSADQRVESECIMENYERYFKIADDDSFIDMPFSSQALYFHILSKVDDIGVLSNVHSVIREIKADESDLTMLLDKKLIFHGEEDLYRIRPW